MRIDLSSPEEISRFIIFSIIMLIGLKILEDKEYIFMKISAALLIPIGFVVYCISGFAEGNWTELNDNLGLYLLAMVVTLMGLSSIAYWVSTRFKVMNSSVDRIKVMSVVFSLLLWWLYCYEIYNNYIA